MLSRNTKILAWASFAAQNLIIVTGGAVRLTGSGLGCSTWPKCTDGSWTTTPEQGIHGAVEFGNRLLTFVLVAIAIWLFVHLWRNHRDRTDLVTLAFLSGMGIPAQAVIGGISVLVKLNPYVVGLHFVVSVALVAINAALLVRVYQPVGPRVRTASLPLMILTHLGSAVAAVVIVVGILSTGSGPHAGDADAPRNGLDVEAVYHLHANIAYVLFALTLTVFVIASVQRNAATRRATALVLGVELIQMAVGIYQARNGLPVLAVGLHMLLAGLLAAAVTVQVMSLKRPIRQVAPTPAT